MNSPKKIVIVAGEESGDVHAANMVTELLAANPALQISGIGGRHMQNAGVALVSNLAQFGVTGISEVLKHAFVIKKAYTAIKTHLEEIRPDLLILVDYPGFNLRLARFARKIPGVQILYYISPQIWAWKARRIKTIKACVDRMAVILPFEKAIYQQAGVPVSFVGHPLVNRIPEQNNLLQSRHKLGLPLDKKCIALLPGSRRNEVERHMPVLVAAAKKLSAKHLNLHFAIPIAASLKPAMVQHYFNGSGIPVSYIYGQAMDVIACSDCVVVASGTASFECALLIKPMCIIYKVSMLTYLFGSALIKVRYLGLCNVLKNKMIVPELLQYDCNTSELANVMENLLTDTQYIDDMKSRLIQLKHELSVQNADCTITELVKELLLPIDGQAGTC